MPSNPSAETNPERGPVYVLCGILLLAVLAIYWFSDYFSSLFETAPVESSLAGAWVLDAERVQEMAAVPEPFTANAQAQPPNSEGPSASMLKDYGKIVITFAPGTIAIDNGGNNGATPTNCTFRTFPPNLFLVGIGDGETKQELVFHLDSSRKPQRLYWNNGGRAVPFIPHESTP